jgi:hypothetical protein
VNGILCQIFILEFALPVKAVAEARIKPERIIPILEKTF